MLAPVHRNVGPALVAPFFVVAALAWVARASPNARAVALVANGLLMFAALVVSTAVHEAAHALVAKAVGLQPTAIVLGRGRPIWRATWRDVGLAVASVPFTGLTRVTAPSLRLLRPRLMLMYAAGPLANAALAAAAFSLPHARVDLAQSPAPLMSFAIINVGLLVTSAIPQPPPRKKSGPGSDGYNFLALPFWKHARLTPMVASHRAWEATRLVARGRRDEARAVVERGLKEHPRHLGLRVMRADLSIATHTWREAIPCLRELLGEPELAEHEAALGLLENDLAWALFMLDDASLLEEADRRSRRALELLPTHPAVNGTRGAVLVAQRAGETARAHLLFAWSRSTAENKAANACCLAMLEAQLGARDEATKWLAVARELDARCPLLARAESSIAAA